MNDTCAPLWNDALARLSAVPAHLKLRLARKMANQILDETRTACPNGGSSVIDGGDWLMGGIPVIPEPPLSECDARGNAGGVAPQYEYRGDDCGGGSGYSKVD